MNRLIRLLQMYLAFAAPLVLACAAWSALGGVRGGAPAYIRYLWEMLSWNLMTWFAALPAFLSLLIVLPSARESTLKRLANLSECDEREEHITGRASRHCYLSSLSVMIFLLFFSVLSIHVNRFQRPDAEGHHGTASIGLHFDLFDHAASHEDSGSVLALDGLPLSKPALLLALVVYQLLTFTLAARREARLD